MIYMMTPNYEPQKKKQSKKQNKASRKPGLKLMLSILLVAALMLTAWIQEKSIAGQRAEDAAIQDFALLTGWADELLLQGALSGEWSFRWDLTLMYGSLEQLADELFRTEKGELLPKNIRAHGNVVDGEAQLSGSYIKLIRTDQDKIAEKITILLQVDGTKVSKAAELQNYIRNMHQWLREKDQNVQMSMKVFGKAKDKGAISSLKNLTVGQTIDEYMDRGTKSATLFSSQVKQYRWVDNEKMANIQAALHESSVDGEYTLTIGVPLISGEFGEVVD